MSKTIGTFRGKPVNADMSKDELLEIIKWLSGEMLHHKKSAEEKGDQLNQELLRTLKPIQANPSSQKWVQS